MKRETSLRLTDDPKYLSLQQDVDRLKQSLVELESILQRSERSNTRRGAVSNNQDSFAGSIQAPPPKDFEEMRDRMSQHDCKISDLDQKMQLLLRPRRPTLLGN